MIPDSSVLVAGYVNSHPAFAAVQAPLLRIRESGRLAAHSIAEFHATITGPAYRVKAEQVESYITQFCDRDPVGPSPAAYPAAVLELGRAGIVGGAIYDGLIALSARDAGETLVSLDQRAAATYRLVGVEFELIAVEDAES